MRILLVDDDGTMRMALEYFLETWGHQVVTAHDGADALDKLAGDRLPDVAVIDHYMPSMDGVTLVTAMRGEPRLASIPVIMISADPTVPQLPGTMTLPKLYLRDYLPGALERARTLRAP